MACIETQEKHACRLLNLPAAAMCQDLPTVPGIEGVGFVESVGEGAGRKFSKGARVVGTPFPLHEKNGRHTAASGLRQLTGSYT